MNGKIHNKFMITSGSEERGLNIQLQRLSKEHFNFLINYSVRTVTPTNLGRGVNGYIQDVLSEFLCFELIKIK